MSPLGAQGQLFILAATLLALGAGLALAPFTTLMLRRTAAWTAHARRRALLILCHAPLVLSVAALVAVLLPSLLASGGDHCHDHGGHLHLCFVHFAEHPASSVALSIVLVVSARALWLGLAASKDLVVAVRRARVLLRHARPEGGASVLPTSRPVCLSLGLLRPRLVLSDGFLAALTAEERAAAIAHERAHIIRRDALQRLVARASSRLYPGSVRARLLVALDTTIELSADEHAAHAVGDRLIVASALVAAERALTRDRVRSPLAMAIDGGVLGERVQALLAEPKHAGSARRVALTLVCLVAVVLALHAPIHHAVESMLAFLFH